jgi:hypothetical protein
MSEPSFLTVEQVEWLHQSLSTALADHMDCVIDFSLEPLCSIPETSKSEIRSEFAAYKIAMTPA